MGEVANNPQPISQRSRSIQLAQRWMRMAKILLKQRIVGQKNLRADADPLD
jgi:hypothetical protein